MKVLETNFDYEKWIEVQSLVKNVNEHNAKFASENASDTENLLASLILCIQNAPVVEVAKVKHGFWINISNDDKWGACSNCARAVDMRQSRLKFNYCPHCGAKMDEKI